MRPSVPRSPSSSRSLPAGRTSEARLLLLAGVFEVRARRLPFCVRLSLHGLDPRLVLSRVPPGRRPRIERLGVALRVAGYSLSDGPEGVAVRAPSRTAAPPSRGAAQNARCPGEPPGAPG